MKAAAIQLEFNFDAQLNWDNETQTSLDYLSSLGLPPELKAAFLDEFIKCFIASYKQHFELHCNDFYEKAYSVGERDYLDGFAELPKAPELPYLDMNFALDRNKDYFARLDDKKFMRFL